MLSRRGMFDKKAFFKSRTMVAVDQTLTCKVPLQVLPSPWCRGIFCICLSGTDKALTAILLQVQILGYQEVDKYYRDASSFQYIQHIRTPCLFIVSTDDPFVRFVPISAPLSPKELMALLLDHQGVDNHFILLLLCIWKHVHLFLKCAIPTFNLSIVYLQGPANRGVQEKSAYSPLSDQAWRSLRAPAGAPALRAVLY